MSGVDLVIAKDGITLNGAEVFVPEDAPIHISDIRSDDIMTVTMTMFVRSLKVEPGSPVSLDSITTSGPPDSTTFTHHYNVSRP